MDPKDNNLDFNTAVDKAKKVYTRFSDFVVNSNIQKDQFLKDNPMYVTQDELKI